jgi:hypothetical protein
MQLIIAPRGAGSLALADGRQVAATRYSLMGEATLDDWYDDQGVWAGQRARAEDGSILDYRRIG